MAAWKFQLCWLWSTRGRTRCLSRKGPRLGMLVVSDLRGSRSRDCICSFILKTHIRRRSGRQPPVAPTHLCLQQPARPFLGRLPGILHSQLAVTQTTWQEGRTQVQGKHHLHVSVSLPLRGTTFNRENRLCKGRNLQPLPGIRSGLHKELKRNMFQLLELGLLPCCSSKAPPAPPAPPSSLWERVMGGGGG